MSLVGQDAYWLGYRGGINRVVTGSMTREATTSTQDDIVSTWAPAHHSRSTRSSAMFTRANAPSRPPVPAV